MRVIDNLVQKSKDWLAFRKTHLGASSSAAILGLSIYETKLEFWEKMTDRSFDVFKGNKFTDYGESMEPIIKTSYEAFKGLKFTNPTCTSDEHEFISASLDGWNNESKSLVEFKASMFPKLENCLKLNSVDEIKSIYNHYWVQVQHQMFIAKVDSCDLATLDSNKELVIVEIPRDDCFIDKTLVPGLVEFWEENIIKDKKPN